MSSFGGFGGFGQGSNATQNTGFGGFGSNNNNNPAGFGTASSGTFGVNNSNNNTNTGGGLFGNTGGFGTGTGGFGSNTTVNTNNSNGGFGPTKPAFGAPANTSSSGLFGTNNNASTTANAGFGGFGASTANNNNNAFGGGAGLFGGGNKPATGFGGGGGGGGLFGSGNTNPSNNSAFGTNTGGAFGGALNNPGIGSNVGDPPGTSVVPFQAYTEKEANGTTTNAFQNVAFQDAYKKWSQDELRLADYAQGRRHGNASGAGAFGISSGFGSGGFGANNTTQTNQASGFGGGANTTGNALFGNTNNTSGGFGQTNTSTGFGTTSGGGLFGNKPATTGFGASTTTTQPTTGGGLFGNAGGGGFGSNAGTAGNSNAFGGATGGGLFGNAGNQNKATSFGGFGNNGTNNTTASPFGATNTTANNAFGTSNPAQNSNTGGNTLFGTNTNNTTLQSGTGGLFGSAQQNSTPAFGTGGGFSSQNQQQPQNAGNSLFANNAQKPAGALFGNTTSGTTGGLFGNTNTTNTSGFGANNSNQPAAGGLFGGPKPATTGTGLFGNSGVTQPTGTGTGGLFGNVSAGNTQAQPQAPGAATMFGSTLGQGQQQKPSMFGTSTQASGTGLFGNTTQQPSNSLFGNASSQPQQTVLGGSLLGASASQVAPSPAPQGLTTSLTDLSAYSSSLFSNMGGAISSSPGPVATPLSKSTARRSSVLPMYKLNPASASRMVTPQKRGFGLSSYGTPTSSATSAAATPGSLNRSLLGSGVGRGLSKSVSANALRRTLNAEDSILAPGAFSASTTSRLYGGTTSGGKKLVINRDMRNDLFSSPNKDRAVDTGSSRKLAKRVSFETDGDSPSPIGLIENGSASQEATPIRTNGNAPIVMAPEGGEQDRGNELAAVREEDSGVGASSKAAVVDPSLEVGPWELSPSWEDISKMTPTQRAAVPNFRISRQNAATIAFKHPVDLTSLTLEDLCGKIVKLKPREASVYPAGTKKPPRGQGLNVPAQLIIYQAWPRHPDNRGLDDASVREHVRKLSRVANTNFENYDKNMGIWTFSVPHFTTYGVDSGSDATDDEGEDDNDDIAIEAQMGSFSSPAPRRYDKSAPSEAHVPGAFEAGVGLSSRRQSFLGNNSVGSPSNEMRLLDDQYTGHMDDEYDISENDDMTRHSSRQHHVAEQDDFSSDGEQEKAHGTTPGGILRARMRALKEAAGPVELQVADGDDWMEMLRKTVSPVKADRQALRARQELFSRRDKDSVSLAAQPKVPSFIDRLHDVASPANMAGLRKESGMGAGLGAVSDLDDGRGFSNSIDLMRSLFDDARTANTGRHVGAMSATPSVHGFVKWPYARKEKSPESVDVDDVETAFRSTIKPNWSPHGTIIYAKSHSPVAGAHALSSSSQNRADTCSKALVCTSKQDICIGRLSGHANTSTVLLRHQLRLSIITTIVQSFGAGGERYTEAIPSVKLQPSALQEMTQLIDANSPSGTQERLVWELASILFDAADDTGNRLARKARLSQFWKSLVQKSSTTTANLAASSEEKALACLSGHMIPEACKHLVEGRNFHLATLVSLIGTSERSKKDMRDQVVAWRQSKMLSEFPLSIRALYELLGGSVCRSEGMQDVPKEDRVEAFVISERFGLDWKRAFGLRLWYAISKDDDISAAVANFKADISSGDERLPPPWYREQGIQPLWEDAGANLRQDLLWGLLQVHADPRVDIESVLRPENSQLSPLDYRLTWQLGVALVATGKMDFGARGTEKMDASTLSFASQLVGEGDWVSAVFVLLHFSDPIRRIHAVQELLARQAGSIGPETGETFRTLTADLRIPAAWIWKAQALYMRSVKGDYEAEVRYLVRAGAFVEAHRVLVDRVAPQAIVELDYTTLNLLMVQFRGREALIHDWANGGEIYDTFLQFAEHHVRGGHIPVHILGKLLTGLPAMESRLGSGNNRNYVKHAAVACMADAVARAVLRHTKELEAVGGDIRAKVQGLPLTSDRRLRYSMDQSWDCFTSQVIS